MSDDSSKPGIPAWQRSQQPLVATEKEDAAPSTNDPSSTIEGQDTNAQPEEESVTPADDTSKLELDQVRAFLDDPAVKDAALGKKRAFLQSKGIPEQVIDKSLETSGGRGDQETIQTSDFATFQKQYATPSQPQSPPENRPAAISAAPPIITYPEFLVKAHEPPPLITPGRVLNATYLAAGLAALCYGASNFLVTPMLHAMTEARHDLATHSHDKVMEFNTRLEKLVSRIPSDVASKTLPGSLAPDNDASEVESITSDPTELYHRDMGTQTSPPRSPRPSPVGLNTLSETSEKTKADVVDDHLRVLDNIEFELHRLTDGLENGAADANKERQDSIDGLHHYLDTLYYAGSNLNVWRANDDNASVKNTAATGGQSGVKEDAVEQLKREIRGVKGVLLSAKRFPSTATVGRAVS